MDVLVTRQGSQPCSLCKNRWPREFDLHDGTPQTLAIYGFGVFLQVLRSIRDYKLDHNNNLVRSAYIKLQCNAMQCGYLPHFPHAQTDQMMDQLPREAMALLVLELPLVKVMFASVRDECHEGPACEAQLMMKRSPSGCSSSSLHYSHPALQAARQGV